MPHLTTPFQSIDHPFVDKMLDGPPQVALRIGAATNDDGDTLVAAIGFGVGAHLETLYGGALMQAVFVAAVGLDSGSHHWRAVAGPSAPPAASARPDLPPEDDPEDDGENTAAELVSLDLLRHLDLPRDGGRYAVIAWLDDLVSDVVIATVPDTATATASAAPTEAPLLSPSTTQTRRPMAPRFDPDSATLALPATDGPVAIFAVDGATRHITSSSWRSFPASAHGIALADYMQTLAPSPYATRIVCLLGTGEVHQLHLPTP